MKLTSNKICFELLKWAQSSTTEIVVPNYYLGSFECDVLKVSKAGHTYEYEIKVSKADFKKDFEKKRRINYLTKETKTKHDILLEGSRVNRFYYVVPEGLIKPDSVPSGLGLIYATAFEYHGTVMVKFNIVKMAKLLKKDSCSTEMYKNLAVNLSIKLYNAKIRLHHCIEIKKQKE